MAAIRRHWKLVCIAGLVGIVLLTLPLFLGPAPRVQAAEGAPGAPGPALPPLDRQRIAWLCGDVGLTAESLAAAGCSAETAGAVFQAVRTWHEANRAAMDRSDGSQAATANRLAEAQRRLHKGPLGEEVRRSLADAWQAVTQAQTELVNLHSSLVATIEARLSDPQKEIWRAGRGHSGAIGLTRYLTDLTGEQARRLAAASYRRDLALAAARTEADRSAARETYARQFETVLSVSQRTAVAAIDTRMRDGLPAVLAAERQTLGELTPAAGVPGQ